jgi:hypothetical protein
LDAWLFKLQTAFECDVQKISTGGYMHLFDTEKIIQQQHQEYLKEALHYQQYKAEAAPARKREISPIIKAWLHKLARYHQKRQYQ